MYICNDQGPNGLYVQNYDMNDRYVWLCLCTMNNQGYELRDTKTMTRACFIF